MIFERICQIIAEQLDIDAEDIRMDSSIQDDLNADSLDVMEVIMAVEHKSGLRIPNKKIKDIFFLKDLYRLFEEAA